MHLGQGNGGPSDEARRLAFKYGRMVAYNRDMYNWYVVNYKSIATNKQAFLTQGSQGWPLYQLWKIRQAAKEAPTTKQTAAAIVEAMAAKAPAPVTTPPDIRTISVPPPAPPITATLPVDSAPPGVPRSLIEQYRMQQTGIPWEP